MDVPHELARRREIYRDDALGLKLFVLRDYFFRHMNSVFFQKGQTPEKILFSADDPAHTIAKKFLKIFRVAEFDLPPASVFHERACQNVRGELVEGSRDLRHTGFVKSVAVHLSHFGLADCESAGFVKNK